MRLTACSCGAEHHERIPRSWWMRLFISRRHYRCNRCQATMFVPKVLMARAGPTQPSPAAPVQHETAHPAA
jgi:hypothetical protein